MAADELLRRDGESELDYHKRLVYGKLVDKTLADIDYSELAEALYGRQYSSDVARRMCYGSKHTLDLMDREVSDSILSKSGVDIIGELESKKIELAKERQKFYDQRMAFTKMLRERSREEELNELIESCILNGDLPELVYEEHICELSNNDLLVSLNDIHYGANIDNAWCRYNSKICAHMMQEYLDRIINIANTHNSENCIVWCAGDLISGSIHRSIQVTNKENVIQQLMGVSELIAEFLAELSKHFNTVRFLSVAGNHSRLEANKENSVTGERLDDLVEWYLSARMQNFGNVIIDDEHKLDHTISTFSVRGKNYVMVHGDYDSPSKAQALQAMVDAPIYAMLCGHLHHNQTDVVQGIKTVMAGSFQGVDSFCVEKRIFGKPQQMVCVCDNTGIVCHYDIDL